MKASVLVVAVLLGAPATGGAQVPARPPDSLPGWFKDDSSWTEGRRCAGTLKRVVGVYFRENTSRQTRQDAADSVQGVVVGGLPLSDGDGAYYLSLPVDNTWKALERAEAVLRRQPQVEEVFLELCASPGARSGS